MGTITALTASRFAFGVTATAINGDGNGLGNTGESPTDNDGALKMSSPFVNGDGVADGKLMEAPNELIDNGVDRTICAAASKGNDETPSITVKTADKERLMT
jgi:hypothetical protein